MDQEIWSDSSGRYLRITGDEGERIGDRILRRQCIRGVLPAEIERVNGRQEYIYEITGYRSLNEYLEERPLYKKQWVELWKQIVEIVEEMEMYLMDGEHLLIDGDHIFLRGDRPEIGGVCLLSHKQKLSEAICRLTEKAIRFPEADRETSEYLYRLHDRTATQEMAKQELFDLLQSEEDGEKEAVASSAGSDRRMHFLNSVKCREHRTAAGKEESKRRSVDKSRITALGILALGLLIPSVLFRFGVFVSSVTGQVNYTLLIAAYLFFLAVAAYGAKLLWPARESPIDYDEEDELSVCLIPRITGLRVLPVMGSPWRIGRDGRMADGVVDREDVSPVHARIQRESRSVYLIDEESPAGTFLNNKRLVPWEKNRVQDGDTVSFGASEFVVEITT